MGGEQRSRATSLTLTFLFTDIESHAEKWDVHPAEMSGALRDHDALVMAAVSRVQGRVVKNEGDGVMAVFVDAARAVEAAVEIQRALAIREWPGVGRLRVRMGLNTGVAEARDDDYFGPEVIRAARVCAAASGGQILATRPVVELARGTTWIDLGQHRLRGFAAPVEIHQAIAAGIEARFPALRTLDAHPNTLRRFRTEFFGHEEDIAAISRLLSSHRLVTLTGVGGCGKTRLAVEVAHDCLGLFEGGAYFADLSSATDVDQLWGSVVRAVQLASGAPGEVERPADRVSRFLERRRALLVLDNCEHLLDSAGDAAELLLDATSELRILATSREGLHLEGERIVQVPSLPLQTDAVRMFRERAAAAGAGPIDDVVATQICKRLDGLPLAIELAAARVGQLGAEEVARRLSDRFRLLTGSARRVPRQRTLEATLDWSHDQLPVDEQIALRRLSVFGGTFSLAAAEAVAGASADTVAALVDKSLVQRAEGGRFRLLETIRAYAEDRLLEAADGDAARGAHTTWLLQVIDSFSDDEVVLATTSRSDEFVSAELENLYAGMAWATSTGDWPTVARVASYAGLAEGLIGRDSFRPVVRYIREALDQGIDGELRYRALAAYTAVAYLEAEAVRVDLWAEVAQRAFRARDPLAVVQLTYLANVLDARSRDVGDQAGMARAREAINRATDIARDLGPQWVMLSTLFEVALAMNASDWAHAADWVDAVRGLQDEGAVGRTSAWVLWMEAVALVAVGRPLPRVDIEARLANVRRQDAGVGAAVHVEALSAADPSHPRRPIDLDRSELDRATRADASAVLISTAALAARAGEWPLAARLLAGARGRGGIFSSPAGVALYRLIVPEVRAALDKPVRDQLLAEVRQLDVSSVYDLAAEWLAQPTA